MFIQQIKQYNSIEMVGSRVYVGGLPYGVRERDLERFFKGYGRTRDILIKNGYGFVVSMFTQFSIIITGLIFYPQLIQILIYVFHRNLKTIETQMMQFMS